MKTRNRILTIVLLIIATAVTSNAADNKQKRVKRLDVPFVTVTESPKKSPAKAMKVVSASTLAGSYSVAGTVNQSYNLNWTCTVTLDASNNNKVWFDYIIPFVTSSGELVTAETTKFYGTLSQDKTQVLIPYPQYYTLDDEELGITIIDSQGYVSTSSGNIILNIANNGSQLVLQDEIILYVNNGFPNNQVTYYSIVEPGAVLTKDGGNGIYVSTAGTLDTKVSGSETSLTISGYLNGADLKVLRDMAVDKNLKDLDIQDATIVGGNSTKYYSDYTASENKTLPPYLE